MIINGSPRKKGINGIDMLHVDDKPLADAHEDAGILANLLGQGLLHLAEVHADGGAALVDRHDMGEVAVGLKVDYLRGVYTRQLVARLEVQVDFVCRHLIRLPTDLPSIGQIALYETERRGSHYFSLIPSSGSRIALPRISNSS